mgnify:CR=1 FL=1
MRVKILSYLRCPACGSSSWDKRITQETEFEMIEGALTCVKCGHECGLRHGIIDAVAGRGAGPAVDETEGWVRFAGNEGWNRTDARYLNAIPFLLAKKLMPDDTLTWDRHCRNFFRTLSHLDLNGKRVLDLGAGRCWSTKYLAMQGAECVATDIMTALNVGLETAAHYLQEQPIYFERVRCDMNELPFNNGAFDMVFGQGAVHHSLDMPRTFHEAARVLSPGGLLVLTNEHCNDWRGEEKIDVKEMPGVHEHCYRAYRLRRWLEEAGFGRLRIIPDAYYYRRDDYCYRRFSKLGRIHPVFIKLKLLIFGGVFNLIARKTG